MSNSCNKDWRCRRICKIGRASARKRPPHCRMQGYGGSTPVAGNGRSPPGAANNGQGVKDHAARRHAGGPAE